MELVDSGRFFERYESDDFGLQALGADQLTLRGPMRPGQAAATLASYFRGGMFAACKQSVRVWETCPPQDRRRPTEPQSIVADLRRQDRAIPHEVSADTIGVTLDMAQLEGLIDNLADYWLMSTRFLSSLDKVYAHPAATMLADLGPPVIPFAVERVPNDPDRWSWVLWRVTGVNPFDASATEEDAQQVWRDWAEANGWNVNAVRGRGTSR